MELKPIIVSVLVIGAMMGFYTWFVYSLDSDALLEFFDKVLA